MPSLKDIKHWQVFEYTIYENNAPRNVYFVGFIHPGIRNTIYGFMLDDLEGDDLKVDLIPIEARWEKVVAIHDDIQFRMEVKDGQVGFRLIRVNDDKESKSAAA